MKGKTTALVAILLLASSQTACTSMVGQSMFTGENEGRLLISADAEGMRAFSDYQTGLVAVGKASPDEKDAHHQLREKQELTKLERVRARLAEIAAKMKGGA